MSVISSVAEASDTDLEQLASLFRAVGDRTRIQILLALVEGEKNVSALCESLSQPQPTVSHHLALLRTHNIVRHRREGRQVYYGLQGQIELDAQGHLVLYVQNFCLRISPIND